MGLLNIVDKRLSDTAEIVSAQQVYEIDFSGAESLGYQLDFDIDTPSAKIVPSASINTTDDTFSLTDHGLVTGLVGQFTTSGALPTGISAATNYFIIRVDANTFKVATSLANAQAGTAVDITAAGTGSQTFTPVALAGASVKLQKSLGRDASETEMWTDEIAVTNQDIVTANITAAGVVFLQKLFPIGKSYRVVIAITSGQLSVSGKAIGKGLR
jgi:hypothetical protein